MQLQTASPSTAKSVFFLLDFSMESVNSEKFISEIAKYPILYRLSSPGDQDNTWRLLAVEFYCTGNICSRFFLVTAVAIAIVHLALSCRNS